MKVKLFTELLDGNIPLKVQIENSELESEINEFIKDKHVIDIKYQSTLTTILDRYGHKEPQYECSALVMYEED
ncbi:sporulation protein Cse60 [Ligilactobacillus murinus]|uniref:sporulation protein Cse60 n=1 Tax=Ligilactobacillus murinus TaxID=1622 RepID=UPI00296B54AB|nr:sporulation protein Cse60 [Ligilactobacillus murinus]WOY88166.1 sporulation protein Cse60 [Ligilactobacillus murinus]